MATMDKEMYPGSRPGPGERGAKPSFGKGKPFGKSKKGRGRGKKPFKKGPRGQADMLDGAMV